MNGSNVLAHLSVGVLLSCTLFCTLDLSNVMALELTFELPDNAKQCFYEDIKDGTESTVEFQVVTGGQYDVDLTIESPTGQILYQDVKKQYDAFTWKADLSGTYSVCFSNEFSTFSHKVVYMDWQVGDDDDLLKSLEPGAEHIKAMTQMESSAQGVFDKLKKMEDYQTHHRLREATSRKRAEDLNERILWWSAGETLVIVLIGISQVVILRSFFRGDKRPITGSVGSSFLLSKSQHIAVRSKNVHTLPDLPYAYNALEPIVSSEIMELHHKKHHATYVNNLNATEEKIKDATAKGDFESVIQLGAAIRFNGGGHINHSIFWKNLSPKGSGAPSGNLLKAINSQFGSVDNFRSKMSAAAIGVQGSGWAWLGVDPERQLLKISTCQNQDPLKASTGLIPLLGIDVWEHAYYLQYKNVRADYVKAIWDVINWTDVEQRFAQATK